MKSVLVTGAGGFIGSHLVEELVKLGANVTAFVKYNSRNDWGLLELLPPDILSEVKVISGDIRDPFFVKKAVKGNEVVFHLAALIGIPYSYEAPESYLAVNTGGTLNVLEACLNQGTTERIVHTSTSEVYGTAKYVPINEGHELNPQSPYAASKVAADKLAQSYYLSFNLPVSTIRPFNTFGPRQSSRAVIPTIITQALKGDVVRIGRLDTVRDLTYVEDTVAAFLRIAQSDKAIGCVHNIGTGVGTTIRELIEIIFDILGRKIDVRVDQERIRPVKSEVMELICDCSRARETLDWAPTYSLEQGLRECVEWIRQHLSRYKPDIYNV